jgi:acetyl esterase/lipase
MDFNDGRDPTLSLKQSNMAASHYASGQDLTNPEISPIFGEFDHTFPNFFISTGTRDLLMSQSILLANKLKASDIFVELNIWEGLWHVFEWNIDLPESRLSLKKVSDFLSKTVAKSESY